MSVNIRFLGAADTVTGSKYLVEQGGLRVMVDCGLFQGYKQLRLRNRGGLGVEAGSVHAVLPVFAVGRAQAILHVIAKLKQQGRIPSSLPVFLDNPMAVSTTELYPRHPHAHKLDAADLESLRHSAHMIETPEASKALARHHGPMVILSASGMATGGRVLHHLALHLPNHRNMVILTGHQAEGTRGASLRDGAVTLRMHGQDVPVRAEVVSLQSASAHADRDQLRAWLKLMPQAPDQVYVVHGERHASDALRCAIGAPIGLARRGARTRQQLVGLKPIHRIKRFDRRQRRLVTAAGAAEFDRQGCAVLNTDQPCIGCLVTATILSGARCLRHGIPGRIQRFRCRRSG